jgi:hypothetical protein
VTEKWRYWRLGRRKRGTASAVVSMMDELFRPTADNARQVIEEQSRQVVEISGSEDGP